MTPSKLKYTDDYAEEASLKDGTKVMFRMIRPSDKDILQRGFEKLSPQSRYFRFFASKLSLSKEELRRLTEIDGINHVAIGASLKKRDGEVDGLGVARFVRVDDDPEVAEPAIAVVDDFHGKGLGTLLMQRLSAAARERGIKRFRCEILAENEKVVSLLGDAGADVWLSKPRGGVLEIELPIPESALEETRASDLKKSPLRRFLAHAASEAVTTRLGKNLLKHIKD